MTETKKHNGVVFQITHPDVEDKCYVGQTRQPLSTRLKTLKKNAEKWAQNPADSDELAMLYQNSNKTKLYEAIMEHGADNMKIDELEVHEHSSKDELIKILKERETHFIKTKNSLENGWNNLSKTETAKRNRDRNKRIVGAIAAIIGIPIITGILYATYSKSGSIEPPSTSDPYVDLTSDPYVDLVTTTLGVLFCLLLFVTLVTYGGRGGRGGG
ncbi:GIY-YIG nuclease family protein, partial [bacterium]|nr:GIY-YIG nuclease family protein [bacterium]